MRVPVEPPCTRIPWPKQPFIIFLLLAPPPITQLFAPKILMPCPFTLLAAGAPGKVPANTTPIQQLVMVTLFAPTANEIASEEVCQMVIALITLPAPDAAITKPFTFPCKPITGV